MNPYTVICYGSDGEPDIRCFETDTPEEAAALAFIENGCLDLHGVYPGAVGVRIDLNFVNTPPMDEVAMKHLQRLQGLATDLEAVIDEWRNEA